MSAASPPIGFSRETGGRTLTDAEFIQLHALLGARAPIHVDHEWARTTSHGGPILSGGALAALLTSSWVGSDVERLAMQDNGFIGAGMVRVELDLQAPVVLGDTVYFRHTLSAARQSKSRPTSWLVTVGTHVRTDRSPTVATGSFTVLAERA